MELSPEAGEGRGERGWQLLIQPAVQTSRPPSLFLPKSLLSTRAWLSATLGPCSKHHAEISSLNLRGQRATRSGGATGAAWSRDRMEDPAELRGKHKKEHGRRRGTTGVGCSQYQPHSLSPHSPTSSRCPQWPPFLCLLFQGPYRSVSRWKASLSILWPHGTWSSVALHDGHLGGGHGCLPAALGVKM